MNRRKRTAEDTPRWQRALVRVRSPWAGVEAGLLATAIACWLLWLAIPDRQPWQLAMAILLGIVLAAGLLWVQSSLFAAVRRRGETVQAWRGAALLAGLLLTWYLVTAIFDAGQLQDGSRAADWNAALSEGRQAFFTEDRLLAWQGLVWSVLRWTVTAALLPLAVEGAATGLHGRWLHRAGTVLRRAVYWPSLVLGGVAGEALVRWILGWYLPGSPEVGKFVLAIIKVALAFSSGAALVCFALALTGTYLRDAERTERRARGEAPLPDEAGAGSEALSRLIWSSRLRAKGDAPLIGKSE